MICPHCHRTIAEQDRYLMSVDRDAPGWLERLSNWADGDRGFGEYLAVVAACVIVVFVVVGLSLLLGGQF